MTTTESIEALLSDLTDENQHQILPILADALSDANRHNEEKALRWALANDKRPSNFVTEVFSSTHVWRSERQEATEDSNYPFLQRLPHDFQRKLRHSDPNEGKGWYGRYYWSLEDAWRAFLEASVKHDALLGDTTK